MIYGPTRFFLRLLLAFLFVGIVVAGAFWAGAAFSGGAPADGWRHGWDGAWYGGFHVLGFLFGLLIFVAIVAAIVHALGGGHRHYAGPGYAGPGYPGYPGYGPGYGWHGRHRHWHDEAWRQEAESAMDDWHRRAHGEGGQSPRGDAGVDAPDAPGNPAGSR